MKLINWMLVGCSLAMASCAPQKEQQQITFADPTIACFDGMYYMYGTQAADGNSCVAVGRSEDVGSTCGNIERWARP